MSTSPSAAGSLFGRIAGVRDRGRPAVIGRDGVVTYGQLLDRAARLACRLGPHDGPVLIVGDKQPAMVVALVAALELGRPYVPLDVTSPPARIAHILDAARPGDAVLAQQVPPALTRELTARGIRAVVLDALAAACVVAGDVEPGPVRSRPSDAEAPAYVLFTSGTTGTPKGVPIPHRALRHFTDWLLATHAFVPGAETFLNQAPLAFDLSVMDVFGALLTGGALFTLGREELADPRLLFRRLDGAPLTVWVSTPSFARLCLAEPRFAQPMLPALRRFLFCGETLPVGIVQALQARFPRAAIWNMYGPTETTVAVTGVCITPAMVASGRPLPVGWSAPGLDVWIAEPGAPATRLPPGLRGEIVVAGPQVAPGYLLAGEGTGAFVLLDDGRQAYRTGDLGFIDPEDGMLCCAGRLDRQIKLSGYRIELEEVEARLRMVPGLTDAAVIAVDHDGRYDHLIAAVVEGEAVVPPLPHDGRALARHVRTALAEWLPDYALPRLVHRVRALPLTVNGKVDRGALRAMLA
jgi:D-alanine--poly(phosphoribitol) ligase subunit 1